MELKELEDETIKIKSGEVVIRPLKNSERDAVTSKLVEIKEDGSVVEREGFIAIRNKEWFLLQVKEIPHTYKEKKWSELSLKEKGEAYELLPLNDLTEIIINLRKLNEPDAEILKK